MSEVFSAVFDLVILAGVVTFLIGWISGEAKAVLTERNRVCVFFMALALFAVLFFAGQLPPLPRIW